MLVSAASGEGAGIRHQTLWVAPAMLRPANTSPIRRIHLILGPIVGRQRASPEPIGPTTDIELKDKGSESRCSHFPNTKEDSDAQAQKTATQLRPRMRPAASPSSRAQPCQRHTHMQQVARCIHVDG